MVNRHLDMKLQFRDYWNRRVNFKSCFYANVVPVIWRN
jgi:hypothetical protein